jgi:hypothetical protein
MTLARILMNIGSLTTTPRRSCSVIPLCGILTRIQSRAISVCVDQHGAALPLRTRPTSPAGAGKADAQVARQQFTRSRSGRRCMHRSTRSQVRARFVLSGQLFVCCDVSLNNFAGPGLGCGEFWTNNASIHARIAQSHLQAASPTTHIVPTWRNFSS